MAVVFVCLFVFSFIYISLGTFYVNDKEEMYAVVSYTFNVLCSKNDFLACISVMHLGKNLVHNCLLSTLVSTEKVNEYIRNYF